MSNLTVNATIFTPTYPPITERFLVIGLPVGLVPPSFTATPTTTTSSTTLLSDDSVAGGNSSVLYSVTGGNSSVPHSVAGVNSSVLQSTTKLPVDVSKLFSGRPIFCNKDSLYQCHDTALSLCEQCSMTGAAVFLSLVLILGICIVIANALVLGVVGRRRILRKTENMDMHRGSLAVADLLNGIQILVIVVANFSWTINSTMQGVRKEARDSYNSPQATVGGIFYLLTFTSSLYNLVYLAGQRAYAFVRPIHYRLQRTRTIVLGLVATWLLALISATVPAWIPDQLVFAYFPNTFLYYAGQLGNADFSSSVGLAILFVLYFTPYLLTVFFLIVSAIFVHKHVQKSAKPVSPYSGRNDDVTKEEIPFFVTTLFMVIGFTITSIPAFVVVLVYYTNVVSFDDISVVYVVCFYVSMTNSLVNVIVYSIRDSKFRASMQSLLCCCCTSDEPPHKVALKKKSSRKNKNAVQDKNSSDLMSSAASTSGQQHNQTVSTNLTTKKNPSSVSSV